MKLACSLGRPGILHKDSWARSHRWRSYFDPNARVCIRHWKPSAQDMVDVSMYLLHLMWFMWYRYRSMLVSWKGLKGTAGMANVKSRSWWSYEARCHALADLLRSLYLCHILVNTAQLSAEALAHETLAHNHIKLWYSKGWVDKNTASLKIVRWGPGTSGILRYTSTAQARTHVF